MGPLTRIAPTSAYLTQVTCCVHQKYLLTSVMEDDLFYLRISEGLKMRKRWAPVLLCNILQEHLFRFTCVKAMAAPKWHRCHCCPNWSQKGDWMLLKGCTSIFTDCFFGEEPDHMHRKSGSTKKTSGTLRSQQRTFTTGTTTMRN